MFDFKTNPIIENGFYIFHYPKLYTDKVSHSKEVYVSSITCHNEAIKTYSYLVIFPNNRDINTCHDFGQYVWVNTYSTVSLRPLWWSRMNDKEIESFKNKLYQFNRPKWQPDNSWLELEI